MLQKEAAERNGLTIHQQLIFAIPRLARRLEVNLRVSHLDMKPPMALKYLVERNDNRHSRKIHITPDQERLPALLQDRKDAALLVQYLEQLKTFYPAQSAEQLYINECIVMAIIRLKELTSFDETQVRKPTAEDESVNYSPT